MKAVAIDRAVALRQAEKLVRQGKLDQAIAEYFTVVEDQPRDWNTANLLGDLWADGEPDWAAACSVREVKLHLYGKVKPKPGRKMGHLTALASSPSDAAAIVLRARNLLTRE